MTSTLHSEPRSSAEDFCSAQRMTLQDLELTLDWATQEGWNPGLNDAACFYQTDPNGFFMTCEGNRMIGAISCVAYDADFGFIGCFIVRPGDRGGRHGLVVGHAAMDYLAGRNVGLDGVLAKQRNYERFGFRPAYRNIRFEARGGLHGPWCGPRFGQIVRLNRVPFHEINDFDARFFPAYRETFLGAWLAQPNAVALGAVDGSRLRGYGVIRSCQIGYKIGPLFAEDTDTAELLYAALIAHAPHAPVYLDVPEGNPAAVALARRHGMRKVFETVRMYNQGEPDIELAGVFGITTFELG